MNELKGTWLMIKTGEDYSDPELIEFDDNKVFHFSVDDKSNLGILTKTKTWEENHSDTKYEFVNPNRIRFFRKGKSHTVLSETKSITEDKIFELDYERIAPIKTSLTKTEIEKLEFNVQWNKEKIKFVFNKDMDSPVI